MFDWTKIFTDLITTLVLALLTFLFKEMLNWVKHKLLNQTKGKEKVILSVSNEQIKYFSSSHITDNKEKIEALNYLKYDFNNLLEQLQLKSYSWEDKLFDKIITFRNFIFYCVFLFLLSLIGLIFKWNKLNTIVNIFGSFGIFIEVFIFSCWIIHNNEIKKKQTILLKELNKALQALGPELTINLFEYLSSIYKADPRKKITEIQKSLEKIGLIVERSELIRVTLSFQLKNKDELEKKRTITEIIGKSTNDFEGYLSIPLDDRIKIESIFVNDYIDNQYAKVKVIPL